MASPLPEKSTLPPYDFSLFRPVLTRFFRRRAHPADVDDLVQEVLLSLHARKATSGIENIEGYLFTVATRALARQSRRRGPPLMHDADTAELLSPEISAERALIARQNLAKAVEIISERLPPRTREVFVLHRFEEMTYPAIGAALGISVSAVEKHIMIALKLLVSEIKGAP